jgi:hypothetical protein
MNKSTSPPSYSEQPLVTARANAEPEMCDKCVELDGKIEHYLRLSSRITDQTTLDGIKGLIEQMKAQKTALHPEQQK